MRAWISGFNMVSLTLQGSVGDCYFLAVLSAMVELRALSGISDSVLGRRNRWYRLILLFSLKTKGVGGIVFPRHHF